MSSGPPSSLPLARYNSSRSLTNSIWKALPTDPVQVQFISETLAVPPLVARCLVARGVTTPESAEAFLHPTLSDIPDPLGMRNLPAAIRLIGGALARREKIRIVGDYDCDGTTGLITLLNVFRLLTPEAEQFLSFHVPDRERDGYGLNPGIVERAAGDGIRVLVSVDIGITAYREWAMVRERGMQGVCLDHHTVLGSSAPEDALVVCPKQAGCDYQEKDLAACGLSLQFGRALLADHPKRDRIIDSLTKLVAIGTVADLVPLSSPANRAIVSQGLKGLSSGSSNPGLSALLEVAGLGGKPISASDLGFRLGPRINAAGRIDGSTLSVVDLFDTKTPDEARRQAAQIDTWNSERQDIQRNLVELLTHEIEKQGTSDFVFVLAGEHDKGWHQGVVGIAASKIVEQYHHPALVCSIRGQMAHGSARSIPQFNMVNALDRIHDGLFHRYGGHAAAAGFALPAERLPELRQRINEYARNILTEDDFVATRRYDGEISVGEITTSLIDAMVQLGPHGIGNPTPKIVVNGVISEFRLLKEQHLKLVVSDGRNRFEAVWWQHGHLADQIAIGVPVQVLGRLEINEWNGYRRPQMVVEDVRYPA
ncbi:MAG: single-stranded-DNA-specific exonuclease RecJ [Blastocatellia bacterium]|nr:single-stranded-DNA-specific exonuclease RecJ [Blastocatellia bacterium]